MNEPIAPANTNTKPAPVPWLGKNANTLIRQTWSPPEQGGIILTLSYPFDKVSHQRCQIRLLQLRFPQICYSVLGMFVFLTVVLVAIIYHKQGNISIKSVLTVIIIATFFSVVIELFTKGAAILTAFFARDEKQIELRVMQNHIHGVETSSPCFMQWTEVARIVERDGDIYLIAKLSFLKPIAIPSTAFADTDTAKRFYTALVALWQANGNLMAIPDNVRAEFAPEDET